MSAQTYVVTAYRWERGWELHLATADGDEVGVTQARTLAAAEHMARDYLALDGRDPDASIELRPALGDDAAHRVAAARAKVDAARAAQLDAAAEFRAAVKDLASSGLSRSDIAKVLHLSTQRVSQLVNSA